MNDFQKFKFDKNSEIYNNKCECISLKPNYIIKNCENSEDDKIEYEQNSIKRKVSTPIFDYYKGLDKILCETYKGSVDITNSMNFIKKQDFITSYSFVANNLNFNYTDINNSITAEENTHENNNYNNYFIIENNNIDINNTDNKNINDIKNNFNNKMEKKISNNNINNYNEVNRNIEFEQIILDDNNINTPMYISNDESNNFDINYSQIMDYYNSIMSNLLMFKKKYQ